MPKLTSLFRRRRRIPYGMFDNAAYGLAAKNARVLERVYHKGNRLTWDGKEVLSTLIEQHGQPELDAERREALGRVFAIIMWGELAAWRISAELADEIEPLEAKMAATSQAFDEARHFYVMHDYLTALGALPDRLEWSATALLQKVMNADHLAKKLLGMQLMVEPIALTLFHVVKKLDIEPVLTGLLPYYERDEARHVALGIQYLPAMIAKMSPLQRIDLWLFQMELLTYEVVGSYRIQRDLMTLGVHPRTMLAVGKGKQLQAFDMVFDTVDTESSLGEALGLILNRYVDVASEITMPNVGDNATIRDRLKKIYMAARYGSDVEPEGNLDPEITDESTPLIQAFKEARAKAEKLRKRKRKTRKQRAAAGN